MITLINFALHQKLKSLVIYGGRGPPLKILQFFKDLIKNKRKNKSKLKVKWNVTAKQRKKND